MFIPRPALAAALLIASTSHAFLATQNGGRNCNSIPGLPSTLSGNNNAPSDESIRREIEVMREEAKERLESLSGQMEGMLKKHEMYHHPHAEAESSFPAASSFEDAEVPLATHMVGNVDHSRPQSSELKDVLTTRAKSTTQQLAPPRHFADASLLYGTRWKAVIQVGSTKHNAALAEGGEKPLLVHLMVDFSAEMLQETDELLQGSAARLLEVKEAWILSGSMTEGRQRPVQIKATGGWKVLPGQGPKGIDILRFYVDVEEEICHSQASSTLRCPAKRVYCTSGFFSMEHHNEAEAFKTNLRDELGRLVNNYEDISLENEKDERLFSIDALKRAKRMMDMRQEIRAMNQKITQARIRDPEKAMLRLSRKGDMGLTKEGQVCYADRKGTASEYLVLGKMEMASIHKPIVESASDLHQLRP